MGWLVGYTPFLVQALYYVIYFLLEKDMVYINIRFVCEYM